MKEFLNGTQINLNLYTPFKGYLFRAAKKLNKHRFREASYSPDATPMAECLTEAAADTSFPGQPNYPVSNNATR